VTPVFHKTHLSKIAWAVTETVQRHAAEWARTESVPDLYAAMSRLGADVALRALFGIDGCTEAGRRIAEVLKRYQLATMQHPPHARMDRADATPTNMLRSLAANAMTIVSLVRDVRALDRSLAEIDGGALDGCIPRFRDVAPSRKALVSWVNHLFGAYNSVDYTIVAHSSRGRTNAGADLSPRCPRTHAGCPADSLYHAPLHRARACPGDGTPRSVRNPSDIEFRHRRAVSQRLHEDH
jgi:hypothetical protein